MVTEIKIFKRKGLVKVDEKARGGGTKIGKRRHLLRSVITLALRWGRMWGEVCVWLTAPAGHNAFSIKNSATFKSPVITGFLFPF